MDIPPGFGKLILDVFRCTEVMVGQVRLDGESRLQIGQHGPGPEDHLGLGVHGDLGHVRDGAVGPRRIGRHSHHSGVQTSKERVQKIQTGWKEQQDPIASRNETLQLGGDCASPEIQTAVGPNNLFRLAIHQECVRTPIRVLDRSALK
jgi:hypothetical protein